jgi:hypothetical protein
METEGCSLWAMRKYGCLHSAIDSVYRKSVGELHVCWHVGPGMTQIDEEFMKRVR